MHKNSQEAVRQFRPYFDNAPVYGHGPSLEDFTAQTPLTVGSPQQVIERTLSFADEFGDYQRQLFLMDHAGLPLPVVLEQLEILGGEVVPVLRKEFESRRPAAVPTTRRPTRPSSRRLGHLQVAPAAARTPTTRAGRGHSMNTPAVSVSPAAPSPHNGAGTPNEPPHRRHQRRAVGALVDPAARRPYRRRGERSGVARGEDAEVSVIELRELATTWRSR